MGYGALSQAGFFGSPAPAVEIFKWGRNGWNSSATSYPNTKPIGALPIATPGPFSLGTGYLTSGTDTGCTGSAATSEDVPGLVGCVGFLSIQGASSGQAAWAAGSDALFRPIDLRDTVPSGEYMYDNSSAPYAFQSPLQSLFSSAGGYANLAKLDPTFTGGGQRYVFYNRTQHTALMAGMGGRMLGYDAVGMRFGEPTWNNTVANEKFMGSTVGTLLTSQATGSIYAGTITSAYPANSGLNLAPTISSVSVTSNYSGGGTANATITWTTDYPATTQIDNISTYNDTVLNTSHSATLTGLSCGTSYTVNAISYDCVANKVQSSVSFTTVACQDLYVSSVTAPGSASPGDTITVGATVNKSGSGSAAASTARIYLYGNLNGTGNKYLKLGDTAVSAFGAGPGSDTVSSSVTIPSWVATGSFSIIVRADLNNAVAEWKENNNRRTISISIVP